jgi:hypothetical protein
MIAFEGIFALMDEDAFGRFMGWNVTAGKTGVLPGFPLRTTTAVHLFQQKGFPGDVQVGIEFVLYALEPLRGPPGVWSSVTAPNSKIVGVAHDVSFVSLSDRVPADMRLRLGLRFCD